jgi:dTDP-4-dehydrorhamnose reductase
VAVTTVAVTGATGLLGPWLVDEAARLGDVVTVARHGADVDCDLTDAAAVARMVASARPDVVVHAAALTDVDRCEREPERAYAANRDAVANLVAAAPAADALVVVSTDQVYPDAPGPHREPGAAPVNVYGASKLAGETAALAHARPLVLRTNIFGPSRTPGRESLSDFYARMLSAGADTMLFGDVRFSPLHLATASRLLVDAVEAGVTGCFNVGSRDGMAKSDFAFAVADHLGLPTSSARVVASTTVAGRARRPSDLRLDVSLFEARMDRVMPTLIEEVKRL